MVYNNVTSATADMLWIELCAKIVHVDIKKERRENTPLFHSIRRCKKVRVGIPPPYTYMLWNKIVANQTQYIFRHSSIF